MGWGVGSRGEACSPAAQASVEAALLLSPGSPCWLSPLCGFHHPIMGPWGGGAAGGPCRDWGRPSQTLGLGFIPAGSQGSGVREEGGPWGDLLLFCICPSLGETPPHEGGGTWPGRERPSEKGLALRTEEEPGRGGWRRGALSLQAVSELGEDRAPGQGSTANPPHRQGEQSRGPRKITPPHPQRPGPSAFSQPLPDPPGTGVCPAQLRSSECRVDTGESGASGQDSCVRSGMGSGVGGRGVW